MRSRELLIVGGGMAGSMAARLATKHGFKVRVFDDNNEWGASRASENFFAMSWAGTLGQNKTAMGLTVLNNLFDIQTMTFWTGKAVRPLLHIPIHDVLWPRRKCRTAHVKAVGDGWLKLDDGKRYQGTVLIANGSWANSLIEGLPRIDCLVGHALLFEGQCEQPLINFWAPYRHQKLFNFDASTVWYGDSTCLLESKYDRKVAVEASLARAAKLGYDKSRLKQVLYGRRPFIQGPQKKGYFAKLADHLFISNSGWKCGLVTYAYHAQLLLDQLKS